MNWTYNLQVMPEKFIFLRVNSRSLSSRKLTSTNTCDRSVSDISRNVVRTFWLDTVTVWSEGSKVNTNKVRFVELNKGNVFKFFWGRLAHPWTPVARPWTFFGQKWTHFPYAPKGGGKSVNILHFFDQISDLAEKCLYSSKHVYTSKHLKNFPTQLKNVYNFWKMFTRVNIFLKM